MRLNHIQAPKRWFGLLPIALAWLIAAGGATPARAAERMLSDYEQAIAAEFQALEQNHQALRRAIVEAKAAVDATDPVGAPARFAAAIETAITEIDTKATTVAGLFDDAGTLPAVRALESFARERSAFVREAKILEQDRTALLQIWEDISSRIAKNQAGLQTIARNLADYRHRLATNRVAIAEYLIVGEIDAAKRLAADILKPHSVAPPRPLDR